MPFVFVVVALVGLSVFVALRGLHPVWSRLRWLRLLLLALVLSASFGMLLRNIGLGRVFESYRSVNLTIVGGVLAGAGSVLLLSLFFTVPLAGLARRLLAIAWPELRGVPVAGAKSERPAPLSGAMDDAPASRPPESNPEVSPPSRPSLSVARPRLVIPRRALLEASVASLPLAGLGIGSVGVVGAFTETRISERPMSFAGLAEPLEGLRILQLTDLHLGAFMTPEGLDRLLARAKAAQPDVVLVTGDLCDYLPWLDRALAGISALAPKHGVFAVFGNHEHYRGALANERAYAKTDIELLDASHRVINIDGAKLCVLGVDDPVGGGRGRGGGDDFYERAADGALSGAPSDAFRLALCHRPSGFEALAKRGVQLTLSGHTHGAQMGIDERSLLEGAMPDRHLWGRYRKGDSQLYTSSGGGHWFAFRLACPSEAALITLHAARKG